MEVLGTPKTLDNYVVHLSHWGVTGITGRRDPAQRETALETGVVGCLFSIAVIPSAARNLPAPAAGKNEIPRYARNDKGLERDWRGSAAARARLASHSKIYPRTLCPQQTRKMALLPFACGEKKFTTSSS